MSIVNGSLVWSLPISHPARVQGADRMLSRYGWYRRNQIISENQNWHNPAPDPQGAVTNGDDRSQESWRRQPV